MRTLISFPALAFAIVLAACAPPIASSTPPPPPVAGVLQVDNAGLDDVDVYTARDGTTVRRVGEVTGLATKAFALTRSDVANATIQFAARTIGSGRSATYVSTNAMTHTGALYTWKLGANGPGSSFLAMRHAARYTNADDGDVALPNEQRAEPPNFARLTAAERIGPCRDPKTGRICRSKTVLEQFQRAHPCPSTGKTAGACPGYVKDHVVPLACGGADATSNLQWQSIIAGKAKDRTERSGCTAAPRVHRRASRPHVRTRTATHRRHTRPK